MDDALELTLGGPLFTVADIPGGDGRLGAGGGGLGMSLGSKDIAPFGALGRSDASLTGLSLRLLLWLLDLRV